jgi:tetratricopeptide (TPR) repeat protein
MTELQNTESARADRANEAAHSARDPVDIYIELADALLALGRQLDAVQEGGQARRRYRAAARAIRDAMDEAPHRADLYTRLAAVRESQQRYADALETYVEGLKLDPASVSTILPHAERLLTPELAGGLAGASELLSNIADQTDLAPDACRSIRSFLGRLALVSGQLEKAIEFYQQVLQSDPADPNALEGLGEAEHRQGDTTAAIQTLERAASEADARQLPRQAAAARLDLSSALLESGNPAQAIDVARTALAHESDLKADLEIVLGRAYLAADNPDAALAALEPLINDPTVMPGRLCEAHVVRARALLALARYQEAVSAADSALASQPAHLQAIRVKAAAILEIGEDPEQAIRLLDVYAARVALDAEGEALLARACRLVGTKRLDQDDPNAAVQFFRRAESIESSTDPMFYWNWAEALRRTATGKDTAEADEINKDARRIWQSGVDLRRPVAQSSWVYVTRALLTRAETGTDEALVWESAFYLELALLLNNTDSMHWAITGLYYGALGLWWVSAHATAKAVELSPESTYALEQRAVSMVKSGDYVGAREVIDRRLAIEFDSWAIAFKGVVLSLLEQYEEALELIPEDTNELWMLDFRGAALRMVHRDDDARRLYQRLWKLYAAQTDKLSNMDSAVDAALYLATNGDPGYFDEALRLSMDRASRWDSQANGTVSIGLIHLMQQNWSEAEKYLNLGISQMSEAPSLDTLLMWDLPQARRLLTAKTDFVSGQTLAAILDRAGRAAATRRSQIARQIQPLEELRSQTQTPGTNQSFAMRAAEARLLCDEERWGEAAEVYRALQAEYPDIDEIRAGITRVSDGFIAAGDAALENGPVDQARVNYDSALTLISAAEPWDASGRAAGARARLGVAEFLLSRVETAEAHWSSAIELFRQSGDSLPGRSLGNLARSLIPNVNDFWKLYQAWQSRSGDSESAPGVHDDFLAASAALFDYLNVKFQLANAPGGTQELAVVTPIVLELGRDLVPDDTRTEHWSLFTTLIPDMRSRLLNDTGVDVPGVRVRQNDDLAARDYAINIDEVPLVVARADDPGSAEDPLTSVIRHLEAVLRRNLAAFLGLEAAEVLLNKWSLDKDAAALVHELLPDRRAHRRIAFVLRSLVADRISLAQWQPVLTAIHAANLSNGSVADIVRRVRLNLAQLLPGTSPTTRRVMLPETAEALVESASERNGDRLSLRVSPLALEQSLATVYNSVGAAENAAVVVHNSLLRPQIRRLAMRELPDLIVLTNEELAAAHDTSGGAMHVGV